jgi:capsular exopolysaccharide synthesis family protein
VRREPLATAVRVTSVPNLSIVTAGPLPPNPPALLARRDLPAMLQALRERFEWILIDSPPLASVTDALLLARHADHTVLVIQHAKVDKKLVKRSVAALRKATPYLLGAVLNVIDVRSRSYQYYYYPQRDGTGRPKKPDPPRPARARA